MCQLTCAYTSSNELNQVITLLLTAETSRLNPDGTGVFCKPYGIWKTTIAARHLSNFGSIMRNHVIKENYPVIAHTRLASKSIAVTSANVHPFDFPNLVGAHNGTLWFEGEVAETTFGESRPSDSHKFFSMLNAELEIETDFVKALQNCLAKVRGKFAFLIYDKRFDKYYAARGYTADLHFASVTTEDTGEFLGFLINTKREDIVLVSNAIGNMYQLMGGPKIKISTPSLMRAETIFELTPSGAEEVGVAHENPLLVPAPKPVQTTFPLTTTQKQDVGTGTRELTKDIKELVEFAEKEFLPPRDLDIIFQTIYGHGILELTKEELEHFLRYIIPSIASCGAIKEYLKLKWIYNLTPSFYAEHKLHFPLGLNNNKKSFVLYALKSVADQRTK